MIRVALVANYAPDAQPSMLRFASLLHNELAARGVDVTTWHPPTVIGGRSQDDGGLAKWRGYADKYLFYPRRLAQTIRREVRGRTVVHICDHSNAVYVPWLRQTPHVVTCHDLIAVRTALGEFPDERTRWTGRHLQASIRRGLQSAARIVCDTEATRQDVRRVVRGSGADTVIFPGVAPAFRPVPRDRAAARI